MRPVTTFASGSGVAQPVLALVSATAIDLDALRAHATTPHHGAVVVFEGIVRDHDHGRAVTELEYQAHPDAAAFLARTCADIAAEHPETRIAAVHRHGVLAVGDVAFAVAVGTAHRGPAFEVCALVVDRVKAELPIWKKQTFDDGTHEWVNFA